MHDVATANTAGLVAVNTTIAPCFAGLIVFFLRAKVVQPKALDVSGFCNVVEPWESAIIGSVGGFLYQGASMLMARFHVDDVVDAFPVHGVNGCWAVLAVGLFGNPAEGIGGNGAFHGGDQFGVQIVAVLLIMFWSGVLSTLILFPLRILGMLRLSDGFQDVGADAMEHSPTKAYNTDVTYNKA